MKLQHALLALQAIAGREVAKFVRQGGRFASALVRPLLWLVVFAAGFQNVFGVSIIPPHDTYNPYRVYRPPVLLAWCCCSKRQAVVARDGLRPRDGMIRFAADCAAAARLSAFAKLLAGTLADGAAGLPFSSSRAPSASTWRERLLTAAGRRARRHDLGALGLLLSVMCANWKHRRTMNFVIFPMFFVSPALYPLWKLEKSGAARSTPSRSGTPSRTRSRRSGSRSTASSPAIRSRSSPAASSCSSRSRPGATTPSGASPGAASRLDMTGRTVGIVPSRRKCVPKWSSALAPRKFRQRRLAAADNGVGFTRTSENARTDQWRKHR